MVGNVEKFILKRILPLRGSLIERPFDKNYDL